MLVGQARLDVRRAVAVMAMLVVGVEHVVVEEMEEAETEGEAVVEVGIEHSFLLWEASVGYSLFCAFLALCSPGKRSSVLGILYLIW